MFMEFLAQVSPEQVDKGVDVLDKIARGSVALILLVLLVLAVIGLIVLFKRELAREAQYRQDASDLVTQLRKDSADAKAEQLSLMRETHKAEKEVDATISATGRAIDRNVTSLDRVERVLIRVETVLDRLERKT